jgi:tetrahydromethanopterin S-methyltransferase subunit G
MSRKEFFPSNEIELEQYLAMEEMSARIQAELNGKISTVLARMDSMQQTFEQTLGPLAVSIQEIEEIKRKINLTPEEVERVYGLKAQTLSNQRGKGIGPPYIKVVGKILYPQIELKKYLHEREVLTNSD